MTLRERRLIAGIAGVELAYCEAIDQEISKTFRPNNWSSSANCLGSFYSTTKYRWLARQLDRYRHITKVVKCLTL